MTDSPARPLLFLDVDGPLIPFGGTAQQRLEPSQVAVNPLLVRLDPDHGRRLTALACELIWATTWMDEANTSVAPLIGLPDLPVVRWPDADHEGSTLHWKTRTLVDRAAGRTFVWIDDEITDHDRVWVSANHRGRALLHRVDPRHGLTDADFAVVDAWLRDPR
ncbi:HAD domain-containing protein [Nocardia sp. NPDC058497]|uniref:HAD domain-containing protein n=1 Tax=Nocardia sp. NPDC058497 TaxID=3346529 RepID=UPI00365AFEB0